MKKLLLLFIWVCCVVPLFSQSYIPYTLGYTGTSMQVLTKNGDTLKIGTSSGQILSRAHISMSTGEPAMYGFKGTLKYFSNTFEKELFVSKGYYAAYVSLKWEVKRYADQITRFYIYRKTYGSTNDSTLVATVPADASEWKDEYAESSVIYKYTLFAAGITSNFVEKYINYIDGIGFRFPAGQVSGRITYKGGTAVENVNVYADTDDQLGGKSIYLNGSSASISYAPDQGDAYFKFDTAFTFQGWFKPVGSPKANLFSKGSQFVVTYESGKVTFSGCGTSTSVSFTEKSDTFFHVAAVYTGDSLKLFVLYNNQTYWTSKVKALSASVSNDNPIYIGASPSVNYFKGYADEIRIWYRGLSNTEVLNKSGIIISGSESGLSAYYRCDEGVGSNAFDLSRTGYTFNEHHSYINNGQWTSVIPLKTQLAYKAITDKNGNYVIAGIPYKTTGSTYHITPMFGVHKFDPTETLLIIGEESTTHSNINFTDASSFPVSGNVKYRGTLFPVQGATLKVDGQTAVSSNGSVITTDANGNFTIDVPIGEHYVSVYMNGHSFENAGRYPQPEVGDAEPLHNFQESVSGLQFIDTTLIKVIGRVAGGPIQAAKTLGFGKTTNNLGNATIKLSTQKQHDLIDSNGKNDSWDNNYYKGGILTLNSKTNWCVTSTDPKSITVNPDPVTGEYTMWLLPEKYTVLSITAGSYTFGDSYKSVVDLSSANSWSTLKDSTVIYTTVEGALDSTTRVDSIRYQLTKSFIYRVTPTIKVTDKNDSTVFWDKTVTIDNQPINLNDSKGNPLTSYPVFTQLNSYTLKVSVFETYTNTNTNKVDNVPVTDGAVKIQNNLSTDVSTQTDTIDANGKVIYSFVAGLPNTTYSISDNDSYTKSLTIIALTGDDGSVKTPWNTFKGYVLGGMPTGNNFVTTGPTKLDMILRDPPGSNSYSYLEKGTTVRHTSSYSSQGTLESTQSATLLLGAKTETFAGIGAGVIVESEITNDVGVGVDIESHWENGTTQSYTTTTTQRWATSESSDFVDAMGDVFIGHSTNIVYGAATFVNLIPVDNCTDCTGPEINGYKIGTKNGVRLNPEFGTSFSFSQNHIQNYLIPNLIKLRNAFFTKGDGKYVSVLATNDAAYGSNNTTSTKSADGRTTVGDSYTINIPSSWPKDSLFVDSIYFFNKQISEWQAILKRNEQEKVEATLNENLSFDAGNTYEHSLSSSESNTQTYYLDFMISPVISAKIGAKIQEFGVQFELEEKVGGGTIQTTENETENTTTYGYVLADDTEGDYISVDVKTPPSQTGPVFAIRGGQTTCPYEDKVVTQYYNPGTVISQATMQREKPSITVEKSIVTDVPEDQDATFNLKISNASETGDAAWFEVIVDGTTNPNGANIKIDGSSIGNGRLVNVPANTTITKVLTIGKTVAGVYDYENIRIIAHSTCQYDPYNSLPDIADTTEVTAYFKPVCTAVNISSPADLWTINTATGTSMDVLIDGYNLQHTTFKSLLFQYKATSSSQWITDQTFFVNKADYDAADKPKAFIDGQSSLTYTWDMSSLTDRDYNIRVKSVCSDNTEHSSTILEGIKDVKTPKLFGTPQPGDGILSPNDDISVSFDEEIQTGLLTSYNFTVKAALNGTKTDHNASLYFDGSQAYVSCLNGPSVKDKSFTIEFWAKRASTGAQVIYALGNDIEVGFDASNKFYAKLGSTTITTSESFTDFVNWAHYAVSFNKADKTANIYVNDQMLRESMPITGSITGSGKLFVGKSAADAQFYNGSLHELRVWEKALSLTKVYANMYTSFNGKELGLLGYWPMNEADGTKAQDKARNRHLVLYGAIWRVYPSGLSRTFNGSSDYLDITTSSKVVITSDMDYTLEFWFKGNSQTNTTLFSNGKANGTDNSPAANDALIVGINASGELYAMNNNLPIVASGESFLDNKWHHFALVMKRAGNVSMYVDAVQKATLTGTDWGGFAGAVMSVGARRYKDNGYQHDNFFNGKIDELRVWNLARELTQVKLDKNAHLSGDEVGLCAYYPFEYYYYNMGVPEIRKTADNRIETPGGDTITVSNGGDYSDDVPNIKDVRPVQNISFDYAANTDKIIVTPTEANALIENTTVEITVQNVEDLNENRLVSPITWTAYINKNQVLWDATELDLKKKVYDKYTFDVNIVNLGGTKETFSLLNLPAWLTASTTSGTLDPNSTQTITFTVNDALSIGTYQEAVFLHSDFGFDEKLVINMNVYADEPSWSVDKDKFQYSMNVIAQLNIDDEISADAGDMVAAFVGNECRGVVHLEYNAAYDKYLAFINIYSNSEMGDSVKFKIWDASEGKIRSKVNPQYVFISNDVKGTISKPIILKAVDGYYTPIALAKGWNWVSFNLKSDDLANLNIMNTSRRITGDQIKGPVDSTGMILFDNYATSAWTTNFQTKGGLKPGYMYMVKSGAADTFGITGSKIKTESMPLTLNKGWNWLGFMPLSAITVNDAFAYYTPQEGDLLKSKYAFAMYSGVSGWIGSLTYMKPGEGYLFSSATGGKLTYPESGLFKSSKVENTANTEVWSNLSANYSQSMSVVAKVILTDNTVASAGWSLGAFVGDECRGIATAQLNPVDKSYSFFLPVAGDAANDKLEFKLYNNDTQKTYAITQRISFSVNALVGSLSAPYILNATEEIDEATGTILECVAQPNPFVNSLRISIQSTYEGTVDVQVCNALGNVVDTRQTSLVKGRNLLTFEQAFASKLAQGVYYLKLSTNGQFKVIKLVKQ